MFVALCTQVVYVYPIMLSQVFGAVSAVLLAGASATTSAGTMLTSWYGPGFFTEISRQTEKCMTRKLSAAHKTLPFGTKLRVCYKGCATVRINDRGPFIGERELDVSYGVAKSIGLIKPGVAEVKVTYLSNN